MDTAKAGHDEIPAAPPKPVPHVGDHSDGSEIDELDLVRDHVDMLYLALQKDGREDVAEGETVEYIDLPGEVDLGGVAIDQIRHESATGKRPVIPRRSSGKEEQVGGRWRLRDDGHDRPRGGFGCQDSG